MTNDSSKTPIIVIKDLHKTFGANKVLDGFNLVLNEGENLVVMGKSGSGKSVMIKCLIGLETPDSGTISVMNKEINTLEQVAIDELRTEIGFLFQGSALYDSMSGKRKFRIPVTKTHQKIWKNKRYYAISY